MAILQIRGLPDDQHAELRRRAEEEGTTMSELAARLLARELAVPSIAQWRRERARRPRQGALVPGVLEALDADRDAWPS